MCEECDGEDEEAVDINGVYFQNDSEDENEALDAPTLLPPKLKPGPSYDNVAMLQKGKSYENVSKGIRAERKIGQRIARIKKLDDTHTNIYNLTELVDMGDNAVSSYEELNMDNN